MVVSCIKNSFKPKLPAFRIVQKETWTSKTNFNAKS